jgi:hypothetical protein
VTALEALAREAWLRWGDYAQWAVCGGCGAWRYCRAHRGSRWLCLDCFDQR